MNRVPRLEVADVIRKHGDEYLKAHSATATQRQVFMANRFRQSKLQLCRR